jgi:hypothetical protein
MGERPGARIRSSTHQKEEQEPVSRTHRWPSVGRASS